MEMVTENEWEREKDSCLLSTSPIDLSIVYGIKLGMQNSRYNKQ
jgi:hypothetical protein